MRGGLAEDDHLAGAGPQQADDRLEQRGLAAAALAEDHGDLAAAHLRADPGKDRQVTVAHDEVPHLHDLFAHGR